MAYSYETSSVKTINGEVSGLADVVARQAIANLPTLSGGEGIQIVSEDGKNRIDLGLSAGSNMSFVYDQETNTIRLDAEGGTGGIDWTTGTDLSAIVQDNGTSSFNLGQTPSGYGLIVDVKHNNLTYTTELLDNKVSTKLSDVTGINYDIRDIGLNPYAAFQGSYIRYQDDTKQLTSSVYSLNENGLTYRNYLSSTWVTPTTSTTTWTWSDINYLKSNSASLGKTYSGDDPIYVNNETNHIGITGESLSAGPGINIFESGGCVVISAGNDDYNFFPITGTDSTTNYTANCDCSSFYFTTAQSPAGANTTMTVKGVHYQAYPSVDVSASWYNIINATNNSSNYYCIKLNSTNTAASLEDYSAYDRVTVIHAEDYGPDYLLHWDGKTKVFPSGLYCEMAKVKDDQNEDKWTFLNSGWTFDFWWDYD